MREKEREKDWRKERRGREEEKEKKRGLLPTGECQDLTGKHGISAPIGKLLYCNHHNKDWISLDSSTDIKSKRKILWQSWYLHGL